MEIDDNRIFSNFRPRLLRGGIFLFGTTPLTLFSPACRRMSANIHIVIHIANSGSRVTFQIAKPKKRKTINLEKLKNEKTKFASLIEKITLAIFENFPKFFQIFPIIFATSDFFKKISGNFQKSPK